MDKSNRLWPVSMVIIFLTIVGAWTVQVQAVQLGSDYVSEQSKIKDVVHTYFELRYRSHNTLQLEDFGALVVDSPKGISFLHFEKDKLEIELHHAKLNDLKYVEYDYFLDFNNISLNPKTESATALVIEGHDVEFEISRKLSAKKPIVSSMRNLQHLIFLQKEDGIWKIVSDDYEDYLWRFIKTTGFTKDDYLRSTENLHTVAQRSDGYFVSTSYCDLQDDESTYPYYRDGAVEYAHDWALSRNPDYYDFSNEGGDCQNFVSQAIYEGGRALMASDDRPTYGWYYNSYSDYASAWTGVEFFYDFVVPGYLEFDTGPEGCILDQGLYQANEGDLIQYDWENNSSWDHSVIIVQSFHGPPDWNHLVASHTPDHDNYPYTYFFYDYPNMVYQFIRIERLDGYSMFLSLILNNYVGMMNKMQAPLLSPYPTPLEAGGYKEPLPYPAQDISKNSNLAPYPAP